MPGIVLVVNTRAERGPLGSVIAALPEAVVVGMDRDEQCGVPPWVMARGLEYFSDVLRGYDVVVLLGDRYETLAAALSACFLRIPIVHIHGGETTRGAFDDAFRHSITHMAQVHCCATKEAKKKLLQLVGKWNEPGAPTNLIHVVGAPGLDGIPGNSAKRDKPVILVTYHPVTRAPDYGITACEMMLDALYLYAGTHKIIFCGVNNDPGCKEIRESIEDFRLQWGGVICDKMTHAEYITEMRRAELVIGNSSSGIIEAPWVGVPSVNIGDRQLGRPMAPSVFQDDAYIPAAIKAALSWRGPWAPCYRGEAAPRIAEIVRGFVK